MTTVTNRPFGLTSDGRQATLFTLKNGNTEVDISNYGATLVAIRTTDKNGQIYDVLLGKDNAAAYQQGGAYLGALIGRNGNRIKNGKFEIGRKEYQMAQNEGANNLHSGPDGFDTRIWNVAVAEKEHGQCLECSLYSPDGDEGFPGNLQVCVRYSLSGNNELILEYFAKTDADTVVNMTNHAYFNLNGDASGSIENHQMTIFGDFYTPVDDDCCPTGEVFSVKGTPFDFTEPHAIGERINNVPDFAITKGYDHNFILRTKERQMTHAVQVAGDQTGIVMDVYTNQQCVQFYAGNQIQEEAGKNGIVYHYRGGFCLETQCCPNAMVQQHLGAPILHAGDVYNYTTIFKFSAK